MTRGLDNVDKIIGANFRAIRIARGMSQEKVGDAVELTFQQIQKYEKGTNAISSTRIPQFCALFNVPPAAFFKGVLGDEKTVPLPAMDTMAVRLALDISDMPLKRRDVFARFVEAMKKL